MRTKFKDWAEPFLLEHPELAKTASEAFKDVKDVPSYLEIGSGKGQLLYLMALHHPEATFYGMERNVTCAGIFAKKAIQLKDHNLVIVHDDFEKCASDIPDGSLDGIFLSFPDPWPKKRHEKRRLLHPRFLALMMPKLKMGGFLRLKTDNDGLFEYARKTLSLSGMELVRDEWDYRGNEPFDEESEYESSFRKKGQPIHLIVYRKGR